MNLLSSILPFALLGYLFGSLPFAVIVSKAMGIADPRSFGSGNPGATNVLRSGNKLAALFTLLGDVLKGWMAVTVAIRLGADPAATAVAGLTAFLGHVFSVFLRFRGGKGVATALGVLAGFHPGLALTVLAVWLLIALVSRYSSAAALAAAAVAPVASWFLSQPTSVTAAVGIMSALLFWRHLDNIRRLLAGTENRIGAKRDESSS
jgi:glycerol-3-phosphate acyltransferase PlsY